MAQLIVDLLRLGAPGLRLNPGRRLAARVVSVDGSGGAVLSIAGARVEARIPAHVHAGDELELVVKEIGTGKVVLSLGGGSADAQPGERASPGDAPPATDLYA